MIGVGRVPGAVGVIFEVKEACPGPVPGGGKPAASAAAAAAAALAATSSLRGRPRLRRVGVAFGSPEEGGTGVIWILRGCPCPLSCNGVDVGGGIEAGMPCGSWPWLTCDGVAGGLRGLAFFLGAGLAT